MLIEERGDVADDGGPILRDVSIELGLKKTHIIISTEEINTNEFQERERERERERNEREKMKEREREHSYKSL